MLSIQEKIFQLDGLKGQVQKWQSEGETVVFTNGCFDLIHRGHLDYLSKARRLGDRLIIGLNSDYSVQRLKGPERPVNDELSRAELLASLYFVDAVVLFEEDTPANLIEGLAPNILVKGGDYVVADIVGYDTVINSGGRVLTIPFLDGFSSTNLIQKIKNL
mgnify:CR=1 FL=1